MSIYQSTRQWMGGLGQGLAFASASSTQSTVLPTGTTSVRLVATQDVWIEITLGASASANVSGFLPARIVEYVPAQAGTQISAKATDVSGTLYIKPCCG